MALKTIVSLALLCFITIPTIVMSQNCNCAPNLCCSQFGFCGTGDPYCGKGCKGGPCTGGGGGNTGGGGGSGSVGDLVTPAFFDGIKNQAGGDCAGKSFYTRDGFLNAFGSFPDFGRGSSDQSKREIAAFFAHVTHETGHLCYVEEINKSNRYCDESNTQYPCAPGKSYYGRGPLQLTWNYNYGSAGQSLNLDLLRSPEMVANDPAIAFKTSIWFWMTNVHSVVNQGFGATIQKINGALECGGRQPNLVQARINYYTDYCRQFGVSPGDNLSC